MKTFFSRIALLGLLCTAATLAHAQWSWIGKDGRKVFSDQPPPADVADKDILKRPGSVVAAPPKPAANAAASGAPVLPKSSGTDKELAARLKQADDAEAARRKAEQDRIARVKADNCERARQAKSTYDAGVPLARVNAKGERELLDADARGAEARRLDAIIASDCG